MEVDSRTHIRPACLLPASQGWEKPTGPELREVIRRAGLTGGQVADLLGLSEKGGGRQVRRWISGDSSIAFSAWAILCEVAGMGQIWAVPERRSKRPYVTQDGLYDTDD
jgi:hypothetical protein